jgi:glycosyltransferase involved in cell wall biosynthesis
VPPNQASTNSINFAPSNPSNSVAVVIPIYNGAKFIVETLNTILGQTVPPAEVIVVNDGSTDNSAEVVASFGNKVRLITIPNAGAPAARNHGATFATSSWFAFCDGDDLWMPTKLEKQLSLANEAPDIQCVLADYSEITDGVVEDRTHFSYAPEDFWIKEPHKTGFVVREPIAQKLTTYQPGITSTPLVKRELFERVGGFDANAMNSAEDTCFHFRCLSQVPFGVVPEVLMHYRRHPASWSADRLKQMKNTVIMWNYIIAQYPQAQSCREELLHGLIAMRKEIAETERYQKRQKLKRMLGWN